MIYVLLFRSKTAYMRYMTLGWDLKKFHDHKPLMHVMKYNLKNILESIFYVIACGYGLNKLGLVIKLQLGSNWFDQTRTHYRF